MFCPKCGAEYEGNYCPNGCNSPFQKPPKKKRLPKWALILIIVGAAVFATCMGLIFGERPESAESGSSSASSAEESSEMSSSETPGSDSPISESSESQSEPFAPENYEEIAWKTLARDPDAYVGQKIKITAKVYQILEGGFLTEAGLRAYQDYDLLEHDTYLQEEWYIPFDVSKYSPKILNSDTVTFYGTFEGTKQMERALTGVKESVPTMSVDQYEILNEE